MPPIFLITGPPAAGKTTVSRALLRHFEFGLHIPVDDMRTWVLSGLSESVQWTDETTRQFTLAEEAAADMARRYHRAGFAVAYDHCRNLARQDEIARLLDEEKVVKVCLCPSLEANLHRNHTRTNKDFDARVLDDIIRGMNEAMATAAPEGWLMLDTTEMTVEETVQAVLTHRRESS